MDKPGRGREDVQMETRVASGPGLLGSEGFPGTQKSQY